MSNFNFLKPVDKNLYEIISDAEKLSYSEMAENLNAIVSAAPSLGENGGLGKVSEELLLGT